MSGFTPRWRQAVAVLVTALSGASVAVLPSISASAAASSPEPLPSVPVSVPKPGAKAAELVYYGTRITNTRPARPKTGDSWVSYFTLHDLRKNRVGDGTTRCSAAAVTQHGVIAQCTRVLRTRGDQVVLLGMDDRSGGPPWNTTAAIVGGTGRFAGVTGAAQVAISDRHLVFKIQPVG
ncbi:hypothetical protein Skr01_15670 [Sphaerisporangium krabiense]|uniref:Dirigent-like protein n=1 Tax=Sphaerisporangium krabiense TaxID=763782 RepID=A0A7W9DMR1_9ACTN|nr:hypothetical protein [Sphaerisporangium krabiense]MBB5624563.1 hypothetical protein [Sphaerisporangium krabiense]GII61482.1 hypothetical protein Skr01_15670 [Sphaerisporangium krabiense]